MSRILYAAFLIVALVCSCSAPSRNVSSYEDLLLPLELEDGSADRDDDDLRRVPMWTLEDGRYPVLPMHPPRRLELGPFPASENCSLHFAPALSPAGRRGSDGVQFTVSLLNDAGEQLLFSELLVPSDAESDWGPRRIELESSSSFSIVLATGVGPNDNRAYDGAAWRAPYLECRRRAVEPSEQRPNVLIVSIDTLRPDHLGIHGYPSRTSPTLDRLAESSFVFESAFSVAPYTLPSHASLLTGLSARAHGAGENSPQAPMREDVPTLAGTLKEAGYRTMAITSGGLVSREFGLSRGFDIWIQRQRARFDGLLPTAFDLMDDGEAPFFLFLHTYDVHGPYVEPDSPPEPNREEFPPAGREWLDVVDLRYHDYQRLARFHDTEEVVAAYDAGIRRVDGQIARLLEHLEQNGLLDSTLLIVTSDHGETLYQQGRYFGHSHTLDDDELRIPLIVRFPEAARKGVSSELVQIHDIAPLVLDTAGVERPALMEGRNPLSDEPPRTVVEGWSPHLGSSFARNRTHKVISPSSERWKKRATVLFGSFIERFETGWQVYALETDPDETVNLATSSGELPEQARALLGRAKSFRDEGAGEAPDDVPAELREELRALGYIQ